MINRRSFLTTAALAAPALAQRDWSGRNPTRYPDPDVVVLDPRFAKIKVGNGSIERLHVGCRWAEGPAWNAVGRYLIWSDIPNDRQLRWVQDDGHVSTFRSPAQYSNGNTFDYEGRQLSCEHDTRRLVRYEHSGKVTVLADKWDGKPLNAPNDVVVHPDGSIWVTDPGYGILVAYEGHLDKQEVKEAVYRIDSKTGKMDKVTDEIFKPNGLCFSPDYKKLYVMSTRKGPGDPASLGEKLEAYVFDVGDNNKVSNQKVFCDYKVDGIVCRGDGVRCDAAGNVWISSNAGRALGYSGVTCWSPQGQCIGRIRLPEVCASLCFGGPKRNRLFMGATQSIYAIYLNTQGAGPA